MNIHEYQAKQVLAKYGAPISKGVPIFSMDDVTGALNELPGPVYVVKSQIHAGGRGKGKFKELPEDARGGVRVSFSEDEVRANVQEMLGNTLVTKQTGPAGKQVNRLYLEDGADIKNELYCSILVNRETGKVAFVASTEGGMDIEAVAEETPEKNHTIDVNAVRPGATGDTTSQAGRMQFATASGPLSVRKRPKELELTTNSYTYAFTLKPTWSLLEVNPLDRAW